MKGNPVVVLLVEDDPAHAEIVRRNLEDFGVANRLIHVSDGEAALDFLYRRGAYQDPTDSPRPDLILLDLRLPRISGMEVLETVKADARVSQIPVVVLTTSAAESDVVRAYDHHVNSYLVKPVELAQFASLLKTLGYYWLAWNAYPY